MKIAFFKPKFLRTGGGEKIGRRPDRGQAETRQRPDRAHTDARQRPDRGHGSKLRRGQRRAEEQSRPSRAQGQAGPGPQPGPSGRFAFLRLSKLTVFFPSVPLHMFTRLINRTLPYIKVHRCLFGLRYLLDAKRSTLRFHI